MNRSFSRLLGIGTGLVGIASLVCAAEQTEPIDAESALALFQTNPDVRVELVAAEPEVFDPVALAFDERGRLYVVENRGYPEDESGLGAIALLEDLDANGRYETRHVFAEGFDFPNGVMAWRGGVLVTCAPRVYFLKDTDGDHRADVRDVVLDGFSPGGSTQLRVSHPTLALDNWIYMTNGLSGGEVFTPNQPDAKVKLGSNDVRFNPLTGAIEPVGGQAQFGLTFDDWGNRFVCSNRHHIRQVVLDPADLARNPYSDRTETVADIATDGEAGRVFPISEGRTTAFAHAGTFTAACGLVIYRGTALGEKHYGNSFVCEPTGNLIHRDTLDPSARRARRGEEGREFLATTDNWFRPVFLANGPDGALYVCDMYRRTVEHPVYLPEEVRAVTDFRSGNDRGRIYRISGKAKTVPAAAGAAKAARVAFPDPEDVERLCAALESGEGWVRDTAHRLLLERNDPAAAPLLRNLLRSNAGHASRVHALRLLDGLGQLNAEDLEWVLNSERSYLKAHAIQLTRRRLKEEPHWIEFLLDTQRLRDPETRLAAALALGDGHDPRPPQRAAVLAELAGDGCDEWMGAAVLSSLGDQAAAFAAAYLAVAQRRDLECAPRLLQSVARIVALRDPPEKVADFVRDHLPPEPAAVARWHVYLLRGALEGVYANAAFPTGPSAMARLAAAVGDPGFAARLRLTMGRVAEIAVNPDILDAVGTKQTRVVAIETLGFADYDTGGPTLASFLAPREPEELQAAAVRALGRFEDPRIAELITEAERWQGYTQAVRGIAIAALTSRPDRVKVLLSAVKNGRVAPWTVPPATRNALMKHADASVQEQATAAFAGLQTADRAQVFEEYKSVLELTPQPASGKAVFEERCASCHRFEGAGHAVGPDLTGIRSQPLESILMHILIPNWLMEEGYESYTVETTNFETFTGIIVAQTESSITLRGALGAELTVPREEIATLRADGLSLMPDDLENGITKQQFRDLLGYLKGES